MKDFFSMSRQQFRIATIISICVVVISAFYIWITWDKDENAENVKYYKSDSGQEAVTDSNNSPDAITDADRTANAKPDNNGGNGGNSDPVSAGDGNNAVSEDSVVASSGNYMMPVEGEVFRVYDMSSLTYFPTLNQYMVHCGIDIRAQEGTEVAAAEDGVVSKVYNDKRMGKTVWIAHEGEITTVYSNLDEMTDVEEGDETAKGQIIGRTGNTSLLEKNDEPHLHFEIIAEGKQVNPSEYLSQ